MDLHQHDDDLSTAEREFTLSTGSILGLFFGLVLLCGLFFGFGYSLGSHRAAPSALAQPSSADAAATGTNPNFKAFKPAAGLPVGATSNPAANASASTLPPTYPSPGTHPQPTPQQPHASPEQTASAETGSAPIVRVTPAAASAPSHASPANGYFLVQVAAVSHQQDAELLLNALHSRGYAATAAHYAQDDFIHIQIGPYTTRHDADMTRQRLVADGYSPIIK